MQQETVAAVERAAREAEKNKVILFYIGQGVNIIGNNGPGFDAKGRSLLPRWFIC